MMDQLWVNHGSLVAFSNVEKIAFDKSKKKKKPVCVHVFIFSPQLSNAEMLLISSAKGTNKTTCVLRAVKRKLRL